MVVFVVGFLFLFTNNFTTDIKTFYLKIDDTQVITDFIDYEFVKDKEYKISIVEPITQGSIYNISVVPNSSDSKCIFSFQADNVLKDYTYISSLTDGFNIQLFDNYFIFSATKDLNEVLQLKYPDKELTGVPETAIDTGIRYFTLLVEKKDSNQCIKINFKLVSE